MIHPLPARLLDLECCKRAVGDDQIGLRLLDVTQERPRHLARLVVELALEAPVPSMPVQRSISSTALPGTSRRRSRDLKPISCTRRWHGAWQPTLPSPPRNSRASSPPRPTTTGPWSTPQP